MSAIENANRQDEMFLTGAGGSKAAMDRIEAGGLYRATFLYNPVMSASAIRLARLIVRERGLRGAGRARGPEQDHRAGHDGDQGERGRRQGARLLGPTRVAARRRRHRPGGPRRRPDSGADSSPWHVRSRCSPASGPTCRSPTSPRAAARGASTASSSRAGATTSTSSPRSPDSAYVRSPARAARVPRPRLLGDRLAPRRPGGVRPDRRAPPRDPAARGVGRRRSRGRPRSARPSG